MCNTALQNISNLQHTPSKYFKYVTHPFKIFQTCNSTPSRNISNVQHTARNFQTCSTLRQTFKCAAPCEKFSDKGVLHRKTLKPQKRRSMGHFCYTYDGAVCSVKLLDSASHAAAVVVAIFTTCFPGLVVRSCRSRYQLVYLGPTSCLLQRMLTLYVCEVDRKPGRIFIAPPPLRSCTFPSSLSRLVRGVVLCTQQVLGS